MPTSSAQQQKGVWGGALLIGGCATGAGMLALPIATGIAGFFPSLVLIGVAWILMLVTGLLLAEVYLRQGAQGNFLSMASSTLGRAGRVLGWSLMLFLFYCLVTAYYTGLSHQLTESMHSELHLSFSMGSVGLATVIGCLGVNLFRTEVVSRVNRLLLVGLIAGYALLIVLGCEQVRLPLLAHHDWSLLPMMLPVVILSFGYHILVPAVVELTSQHPSSIRRAIFYGSLIPLIVYILWQLVVLGSIPVEGEFGLRDSCARGLLATHSLRGLYGGSLIVKVGDLFVLFAIVTSLIPVGMGFRDFWADGLRIAHHHWWGRPLAASLALLPPALFALWDPTLFLSALSWAGGVGVATLFVIMPAWMVWRARYVLDLPGPTLVRGGRLTLVVVLLGGAMTLVLQFALALQRWT